MLGIAAAGVRAAAQQGFKIPAEISQAQATLSAWLTGLTDQKSAAIMAQLGNPAERTSWEFQGKKELLLQYKMDHPKATLLLYFYQGHVIKVSLQLLSE
ncbi:MAG: hypothetical protein ABI411_11585 [Tahibacter sp.]